MTTETRLEVYHDTRLGGVDEVILGDRRDAEVRIPDKILDCVVFLCAKSRKDTPPPYKIGGTGFVLSVQQELVHHYLITAKHIIEQAKRLGDLYIRINRRDGNAEFLKIDGEWTYSEDEGSDVAVISVPPEMGGDIYEYETLPSEMCVTDRVLEEYRIGVGDDLFLVGLFTQRCGGKRNIPVVRMANVSAMPTEALQDENSGLEYNAYLAEVHSIGGLSGSPVFAFLGIRRESSGHSGWARAGGIFLLGLVRGHWDIKKMAQAVDFSVDDLEQVNMGIAIVTPIQEASKVIHSEKFMKDRRKKDLNFLQEQAPKLDDGFVEGEKPVFTKQDFVRALKKVSRRVRGPKSSH